MAVVLANDNILLVEWIASCLGQSAVTNRYWRVVDATPGPTDRDAGLSLDTIFAPLIKDLMTSVAQYRGLQVRRFRPITVPLPGWQVVTASAGGGTSGDTPLPTQATGLLHLGSEALRRSGRYYAPFPSTDDTDVLGSPLVAYLDKLDALGAAMTLQPVVTAGGGSCTLLPVLNTPAGFLDVTSFFSKDAWATQMRRGQFRRGDVMPF